MDINFNLWDFVMSIYEFIIDMANAFYQVWYFEFQVGDWTFKFREILGVSFVVIVGLLLIKKLIPVA